MWLNHHFYVVVNLAKFSFKSSTPAIWEKKTMDGRLVTWQCASCSWTAELTSMRAAVSRRNPWIALEKTRMEVLYHIRPYFGVIFPYIGLI